MRPESSPEPAKVFIIGLEGFSILYDAPRDRIVSEIEIASLVAPEDPIRSEQWSDADL
ncbi:MAG: hypothetical protein JXA90_11545 [Planctomycetes bacterium]|nr:hypothetical protein [Planctomycetota bacterium]